MVKSYIVLTNIVQLSTKQKLLWNKSQQKES